MGLVVSDSTVAAQTPAAQPEGLQAPQTYTKFATIKGVGMSRFTFSLPVAQ